LPVNFQHPGSVGALISGIAVVACIVAGINVVSPGTAGRLVNR